MTMHLFKQFVEVIENLPVKGVLRMTRLQQRMLSEDLARKRTLPIKDARSILAFCDFLDNASKGNPVSPVEVPIQHVAIYKKIVSRLIEEDELPFEAADLFDATFAVKILKSVII